MQIYLEPVLLLKKTISNFAAISHLFPIFELNTIIVYTSMYL